MSHPNIRFLDRAKETTTTTGSGTITLGGAVASFVAISGVGNGNSTYYTLQEGNNFEIGIGTYATAGNTLSRDEVFSSSNSDDSKIDLAGSTTVFITYPADKAVVKTSGNYVGIGIDPEYQLQVSGTGSFNTVRWADGTTQTTADTDTTYTAGTGLTLVGTVFRTSGTGYFDSLGIGTDSPTYLLDVAGNAGFNEYIYHNGDDDTYIQFGTDQIDFVVGAANMIYLNEGGGGDQEDKVTINNDLADVDFQVKGDTDPNLFRTDAANDKVGIGTSTPTYKLDVSGSIGINENIYHNGDADTFIAFVDDSVNIVAGGKSAIKLNLSEGRIQLNNTNADLDVQMMADDGEVILHTDAGTNNVGIGTTTPGYTLEVSGTGSFNTVRWADGTTQVTSATGDISTVSGLTVTNATNIASTGATNSAAISSVSGLLYDYWNVTDGSNSENISSTDSVKFTGAGATTVAYSPSTNTVTITTPSSETSYDYWTASDSSTTSNISNSNIVKFSGAGDMRVTLASGSPNIVTISGSGMSYSAGSGLQLNDTTFDAITATTSAIGITQLQDSATDGTTNRAITPNAVYDISGVLSTSIASTGSTNAASIATNTSNISTNTTNIASTGATNASSIATNTSNISTNTTNIASTGAINSALIATNTTNIATNVTNIASTGATNAAAIAAKDNYQYWTVTDGGTTSNISTTEDVKITGAGQVTVSLASGNPNVFTVSGAAAGGGAPTDAQYITLALDGDLSAERVLTSSTGIHLVDGGANGNVTVSVSGATTSQSGIVQLQDSATDGTTDKAITPNAVYDIQTTLQTNINTNTTNIASTGATNAAAILANTSNISTNTTNIASTGATNAAAILANTSNISTNTTNIASTGATNAAAILANTSNISTNTTNIASTGATNAAAILANTSNISTNTTNIASTGATNAAAILANTSNISTNTTNIASTGATNAAAILANTSNISTNTTNIASTGATNAAAIATKAPNDAQYVALATDGDLSAERVLTAGSGIRIVDAGANGAVTLHGSGVTVTAGTGLSNGGSVALGASISVDADTATTSAVGVVQLQDSATDGTTDKAITPNAVYDIQTTLQTNINTNTTNIASTGATNAAAILANTSNISTNASNIASTGATNAAAILANTSNISTNASNISTNATNIASTGATNAAAILANTSNISTNASNIASTGATNAAAILANTSNISTNASNISTNATNIASTGATNAAAILANTSNISTNASNIASTGATNAAAILANTSNISTNASNISTNATNIASTGATNAAAILANTSNISTNASNISTNATNIASTGATNAAAILANTSNISTNASNIASTGATNAAAIAAKDNYRYWTITDGSNTSNLQTTEDVKITGAGQVTVTLASGNPNVVTVSGAAAGGGGGSPGGSDTQVQFNDSSSFGGDSDLTWNKTTNVLTVAGHIAAITKSFLIDHPVKEDKKLQYASLEGPENGVYVRGHTTSHVIELPDYWVALVDHESITVHLTPNGTPQPSLYVNRVSANKVYLSSDQQISAYYTVSATRKDVPPLEVEI